MMGPSIEMSESLARFSSTYLLNDAKSMLSYFHQDLNYFLLTVLILRLQMGLTKLMES